MDDDWTPRWSLSAPLEDLPLDASEGFVLSRLDGRTRVADLPVLTGLPKQQIAAALQKLVDLGAVQAPAAAAPVQNGGAAARGSAATTGSTSGRAASATRATPTQEVAASGLEPLPDAEAFDASSDEALEGDAESEGAEEEAQVPDAEVDSAGTHRKLYETQLHPLPADERVVRASKATEPELSAFCYDPLPAVVKALLANPSLGLSQARLIAQHHHHPIGLDALATRASFVQDAGVRKRLLQNPHLPAGLFNRLFSSRSLRELYLAAISRDIPETTRRLSREALRRRFGNADAEQRVALIMKSEGRVLAMLTAIPIDGRTLSQLCARPYSSTMLVQNIARWSAAPPALIAHLLRQELVRRSPSLRIMLQRHPNAPRS